MVQMYLKSKRSNQSHLMPSWDQGHSIQAKRERERESLLPLQFSKEQQAENAFSKDDNDLQVAHDLKLTASRCSAKNPR